MLGVKLKTDVQRFMKAKGLGKNARIQRYVDSEVIRLMSPYTPKQDGALIDSATRRTLTGSGLVEQGGPSAPYARKWYYEDANFTGAPMRGKLWFERMKDNGGAQSILKGIRRKL